MSRAVSLQFTVAREGLVTHLAEVVHGRQQAGSYWSSSARISYLTPTDDKEYSRTKKILFKQKLRILETQWSFLALCDCLVNFCYAWAVEFPKYVFINDSLNMFSSFWFKLIYLTLYKMAHIYNLVIALHVIIFLNSTRSPHLIQRF